MLEEVTVPKCFYQAKVFHELNASSVELLQSVFVQSLHLHLCRPHQRPPDTSALLARMVCSSGSRWRAHSGQSLSDAEHPRSSSKGLHMYTPPLICVTVWTLRDSGDKRRGDLRLLAFTRLQLRLAVALGVAPSNFGLWRRGERGT